MAPKDILGRIEKEIAKVEPPRWVLIIVFFSFLLRIPSLLEPYTYGDEMIYLAIGHGIRNGLSLYGQLHDNKPPLIYLLSALAGNLFWMKAILAVVNTVSIIVFYKIVSLVFDKSQKAQKVAVIFFAILTTLPLFEGNIVNGEVIMLLPTLIAIYLLLRKGNHRNGDLFTAGVFFGIAALVKIPAMFELAVVPALWLIKDGFSVKNISLVIKKSIILFLGFLTPLAVSFIYYSMVGNGQDYIRAAFLQNYGYINSWKGNAVKVSFLTKNGPLLIRGIIAGVFVGVTYLFRKKLSTPFILGTIWVVITLFAATLSERPYPHYLMQTAPALSILVAILLVAQTVEQSFTVIPLSLLLTTCLVFKFWYYPTGKYYSDFLQRIKGAYTESGFSKEAYIGSFGEETARNYQIAEIVKSVTAKKDYLFVWGDSAPLYALTGNSPAIKYVADYHINDFSDTETELRKVAQARPKVIVVMGNYKTPPLGFTTFVRENYIRIHETEDGSEVWKAR